MNKNQLENAKNRLLKEKKSIEKHISNIEEYSIGKNEGLRSELSNYDNHPADTGGELASIEQGMALKNNEQHILNKIDGALQQIEEGTYGRCKKCENNILQERLEFLPYAEYCMNCQEELSSEARPKEEESQISEEIFGNRLGYGYSDASRQFHMYDDEAFREVGQFNHMENAQDLYDDTGYVEDDYVGNDYVEAIDGISNEYYKNQLPD